MNQASSHVEDAETEEPGHDEYDCQREKHEVFLEGIPSFPRCGGRLGSTWNATGCAGSVESIVRLDSDLVRKDYFDGQGRGAGRAGRADHRGIAALHENAATSNQWLPVSFANTSWTRLSAA